MSLSPQCKNTSDITNLTQLVAAGFGGLTNKWSSPRSTRCQGECRSFWQSQRTRLWYRQADRCWWKRTSRIYFNALSLLFLERVRPTLPARSCLSLCRQLLFCFPACLPLLAGLLAGWQQTPVAKLEQTRDPQPGYLPQWSVPNIWPGETEREEEEGQLCYIIM